MKIKYTSASPKAGQTEHLQPNICATLIAAGFAEPCGPPPMRGTREWFAEMQELHGVPAPTPTVSWGVYIGQIAKCPAIVASCSNSNCTVKFRFEGNFARQQHPRHGEEPLHLFEKRISDAASKVVFTHSCGHKTPDKVSAAIVKQFVAAVVKNPREFTSDEAKVISFAVFKGDSGQHREVVQGVPLQRGPLAFELPE
jgi:hypothetical protein